MKERQKSKEWIFQIFFDLFRIVNIFFSLSYWSIIVIKAFNNSTHNNYLRRSNQTFLFFFGLWGQEHRLNSEARTHSISINRRWGVVWRFERRTLELLRVDRRQWSRRIERDGRYRRLENKWRAGTVSAHIHSVWKANSIQLNPVMINYCFPIAGFSLSMPRKKS